MGNAAWYVIQSKPNKENQVYTYLVSRDIEVFYPTYEIKPVNPRSARIRPYFPRYMFVHVDLEAVGMSALKWFPGAIGLVHFDGYAAPVADAVIHQIKERIEQVRAAGGPVFDGLKQGDPVRITSGPLAGYEAIFDLRLSGSERVQVLLDMLGRLVRVKVDASAIEKKTRPA